MARTDDGNRSSTGSYERHESVGPGSSTTTGADPPPTVAHERVIPVRSRTDKTSATINPAPHPDPRTGSHHRLSQPNSAARPCAQPARRHEGVVSRGLEGF